MVSKNAVLGVLVDRAICMPYAKPQLLSDGHRTHNGDQVESISSDTIDAAGFLRDCLSESAEASRDHHWSAAHLAVDPAGPWWSKTVHDFYGVTARDRKWVLDRLIPTVALAGEALTESAVDEQWTWLWSQPSLARPASPGRWGGRPVIMRPDLVAGLKSPGCLLIDLKLTSGAAVSSSDFLAWKRAFEQGMGFEVRGCWRLVVNVPSGQARWVRDG